MNRIQIGAALAIVVMLGGWLGPAELLTPVAATTQPQDPAATIAMLEQRLAAYRHLLSDWAGLTRYGSEDSEIKPPAPGENRVVFIGDQITEFWGRGQARFFPGRPYFNRGIGGQTSPQMLVRFRQDVIALKPRVVVIQAGTNDIAGVTGPGTRGTWSDHIMSMTDLARANGIRVVLASITPVCDCTTVQTDLQAARQNRRLEWVVERLRGGQRVGVSRLLCGARGRAEPAEGIYHGRTPSERCRLRGDGAARRAGDCGGAQINWCIGEFVNW